MSDHRNPKWSFYIDRGGTFTDVMAYDPNGQPHTLKLLSQDIRHYSDPVIEGIRRVMGIAKNQSLPTEDIELVHVGTTLATNALLERKGARVLWITHQGFKDALLIGHQNRQHLFDQQIPPHIPLYEAVAEISGRVDTEGQSIETLDVEALKRHLESAKQAGIESVGVCTFHAPLYPELEQEIGHHIEAFGFSTLSLSHQISPHMGWVDRAHTTLVDAYLSPIIQQYAQSLNQALNPAGQDHEVDLRFMKSDGGLSRYDHLRGHQALLSGPAGGLVGCLETAKECGLNQVIAFDMGGTSTDVAFLAGQGQTVMEYAIDGMNLTTPTLDIHTIASGGGSCIHFDGQRLSVGPTSAGAAPGPACYRLNGPLTTTDCNVILGRLSPNYLPKKFGPSRNEAIDAIAPQMLMQALRQEVNQQTGQSLSIEELAQGCIDIAVTQMANAIKKVTSQRGHDVSQAALNCFGGAGGQHALAVAEELGLSEVLIHPLSGILSAVGLSMGKPTELVEFSLERDLDQVTDDELDELFAHSRNEAKHRLLKQQIHFQDIQYSERLILCYAGSTTRINLERDLLQKMRRTFDQRHETLYGMQRPNATVYVVAGLVEATGPQARPTTQVSKTPIQDSTPPPPTEWTEIYLDSQWRKSPVYHLKDLPENTTVQGPALVISAHSTIVILKHWSATVAASGIIKAKHNQTLASTHHHSSHTTVGTQDTAHPITLEIFNGLFGSITEQMGTVLAHTAWSPNIKERRDFSCALFNQYGELIANAPHVPVHLGSMGASVKAVIANFGHGIKPGDGYLLNDPFNGGTHLPDLTLIHPAFNSRGKLTHWVANRAHHADVGGITPGSMPPHSSHIDSEGVLFEPMKIISEGELDEHSFKARLQSASYPARNIAENLADLHAQCAANHAGLRAMDLVIAQMGEERTLQYMEHTLSLGEKKTRAALSQLPLDSPKCWKQIMDQGDVICVEASRKSDGRVLIDFSGTSPQSASNFNAPTAITRACVLYVLRWIVGEEMPLNDGCLRAVDIRIPSHSLLDPVAPAAVVAGNVETSQVITDALLATLGLIANGPGTMNNLTFGTETYQHYETLCGGGGATAHGHGSTGKHVHMTNSRLTDPEILESRFPITLEAFGIRQHSGGRGCWSGGDGVFRSLRFNEPMQVSLLGNSRSVKPLGLQGGECGQSGLNQLIDRSGHEHQLAGCVTFEVQGGEILTILTPGGGGYGTHS